MKNSIATVNKFIQVGTKAVEDEKPETVVTEETSTGSDEIESADTTSSNEGTSEEKEKLPSTATSVRFIGVVGLSLAALASVLAFFKKKQ